ncbi:MAG: ABC transporter ATP-binding protein [Planctomycetes bacterium]|nr:ABC transporter ATP-binding protein [Planctomycetota bacterium]
MAQVAGQNLTKRFGEATALSGVSFAAPAGGVLLVLGPSGAGKTTLLRLVAGLEEPDEGTVSIGGEPVTGGGVFVPPHRRGVAFVFQRPTLWPHMTALDNVALVLVGRGLRRRRRRRRAAEMLDRLGMSERLAAYPATLSGGELQRVSLARALVSEPRVLLLDEPFASLDASLRQELVRELAALKSEQGVTMLWVGHRYEEALALADRLLLLRDGVVKESGEPQTVLARPRSAFGARFLVDANILAGRVTGRGLAETILGEVACPGRHPGESVLLAVPPEAIAVSTNGSVRGTVVRAEFRGRYFAYQVRLGDQTVRVHLTERLGEGAVVLLRLKRAPALLKDG